MVTLASISGTFVMMIMRELTLTLYLLEVGPLTELESSLFSQNRLINALINFIQNTALWKLLFILIVFTGLELVSK